MTKPVSSPTMIQEAAALWSSFETALAQKGMSLPQHPQALEALRTGFAFSRYVSRICAQYPDVAVDLMASGDLITAYGKRDLSDRCRRLVFPDADVPAGEAGPPPLSRETFQRQLRRFRHREMLRIAVRDLHGMADVDTTMADVSRLADGCLQTALDFESAALNELWGAPMDSDGRPQQMVVIGLGKLGASELNFSSDVDLLFSYPVNGQTRGGNRGTTGNEAFFERLGRNLIQTIGGHTADGFVFRVDMRLRPYGDSGPLVMTFDRLETYYEEQGREWERYALIKARPVAGDKVSGEHLLERLKPFVFRRYLDYGAFDSLRDMKGRIAAEVRQKGMQDNIKLGPGGIREIEFFGQMFQLIRGGVDADLQIRPIRQVLGLLARKGYISEAVQRELDEGYLFLRIVENRLQQWRDQQTHKLPADAEQRMILAQSLGFDGWPDFEERLQILRRKVHHHFDNLLAADKKEQNGSDGQQLQMFAGIWQGVVDAERGRQTLTQLGFTEARKTWDEIESLKNDRILKTLSATGRSRLDRLIPLILQTAGDADEPESVLTRLFELVRSICKRTSYLALLLENPTILIHLARLAGESVWIADFLSHHPVLLDELLDPRSLYRPPRRSELAEELERRLTAADEDDLEYQMEILRVFKQVNVLRVAASDITHVLPLMKVSDHLTDIAEIILGRVVAICWRNLAKKHGFPACQLGDAPCDQGFAVVGYGKLGGLELGYGSDLDLVFLHAARPGETDGGPRPVDNTLFFGRLGQRVLHMLSTHTSAGVLYPADMRLRPSGDSGMLVSHVDGFRDYQHNDAWTWEHQALIRARTVTGDQALQKRFEAIRLEILTMKRHPDTLREDVSSMRFRLREQAKPADPSVFDIKQGTGGMVDIEFIVQYLVLRHAWRYPKIVRWTDNVRLLQSLHETGIIDNTTAFGLRRAYLIYRAMVHRLNLRQQPSQVEDERFDRARKFVNRIWNRMLLPE